MCSKTPVASVATPEVIDRTKGHFLVPGIRYLRGEVLDMVRDALTMMPRAPAGCIGPTPSMRCCLRRTNHRTTLGSNALWQLAVLEMWLQSMEGSKEMGQQVRELYGASLSPDCNRVRPHRRRRRLSTRSARFLRGGEPARRGMWSFPSRVRSLASCTPRTGSGWRVRSGSTVADRAAKFGSSPLIPMTGWPGASITKGPDTAELIAWDGTLVAAILTGEDGVGRSCLIDPADGRHTVLDLRSGGRLVDAWAGASLVRVGPRGYHEMIMLFGKTEIGLLPSDPGSTTAAGIILDDHQPRRLRYGLSGEQTSCTTRAAVPTDTCGR